MAQVCGPPAVTVFQVAVPTWVGLLRLVPLVPSPIWP